MEKLMDTLLGKALGSVIATLFLVIIGQGLVIWKNQDSFSKELNAISEQMTVISALSRKMTIMEGDTKQIVDRITRIEELENSISSERQSKGGTFRRNEAESLKTNLLDRISIEDGRISALEFKMGNAEQRINECRQNVGKYALVEEFKELEEDVEDMQDEHETAFEEISEKCKTVLERIK